MKTCHIGLAALALAAAAAPSRAADADWVQESNADAQILLKAIGSYSPEEVSDDGLSEFDDGVTDMRPGLDERSRAALQGAEDALGAKLASEGDPRVRQDLEILIRACRNRITDTELDHRLLLDFNDIPRSFFVAQFSLLQNQVSPGRRPAALVRLRKMTGLEPGYTPMTELAKALFAESLRGPSRLGPFRGRVQTSIDDVPRYVAGIRQLYATFRIPGAGKALDAMEAQLGDFARWEKQEVLPHSREDFRQPPEIYAEDLVDVGLGITPEDLIAKARLEYTETQAELASLAPLVAKERGLPDTDYRPVVRALKKDQLSTAELEPYYHQVIAAIEANIRKEHIIALPDRPLIMRLASAAETASQPAPHYLPPQIIGNTGQRGQFVLPLNNPGASASPEDKYDDFSFRAAAWTLSAHEGRPGHDLQFTAMIERGVSLARSIFAFNSVNVEGWALYSEAVYKPYEPIDGQLVALQLRLLRAARAILDPMLNLGMISRPRAHDILTNDVCLSEAFTKEELDRFTFRNPGQATAYFYGYSRIMEMRAEAEIALGDRFDRYAFNNFLISQGLLPPDILQKAVETDFIPSQK
ncbi:MAG TPA: DUF885 domain-containing protein [Opitutaceae bacterium]|jgi:hypothetical protein